MSDKPLALYLHIPFCAAKCAYCDFASWAGRQDELPAYLDALQTELRARAMGPRPVRSVFFGGGTPTLLSGNQVRALLDEISNNFGIEAGAEITMEGNPGTLRAKDLAEYRAAGVNRFSLGAQAAQGHLLETLGRIHRWPDVELGVSMLRAAGFDNLNVDLMFGLPGQTLDEWRETLEAALVLEPQHLSCYGLQVEEGTPLAGRLAAGEAPGISSLPDEDSEREMYAQARRAAARAGLMQYELSNFARPGFECRQNTVYWTRGDYLGIGCAAHSLMGCTRRGNTPLLETYMKAVRAGADPAAEHEEISKDEARFEALMLGLRLTGGIDCAAFAARYGATPEEVWTERLAALIGQGMLEMTENRLRLTERGMDVQNAVLVALMG